MIVVDSFGWIESFIKGPRVAQYRGYFNTPESIITPTIVVYEVIKKLKREQSPLDVSMAEALMQKTHIVELTSYLAIKSAQVSLEYKLAMADSIVYATALHHQVELVTSDPHFKGMEKVIWIG